MGGDIVSILPEETEVNLLGGGVGGEHLAPVLVARPLAPQILFMPVAHAVVNTVRVALVDIVSCALPRWLCADACGA